MLKLQKSSLLWALALTLLSSVLAQEVYIDNVVIILDASGSMENNMRGSGVKKIDSAKSAIKDIVSRLPSSTHLGLLVFGGARQGWIQKLGPIQKNTLFSEIDRMTANGGTPLGDYMKKGADQLLLARKAQYGYGSYRMLIVTDGEASDPKLVEAYTPDIISRGIITDVIGVDMASAHTLATRVHSYRRANDPESLKKALREVFAEIQGTASADSMEEAFAELQGLPEGLALPMLQALGSSGDHPIQGLGNSNTPAPVPSGPAPAVHSPAPKVVTPVSTKSSGNNWLIYAFLAFVGYTILRNLFRRR